MNTSATISNSIMTRVNKINYAAKFGYATKHHPLYPEAYRDYCPALNIMTEEVFNELCNEPIFGVINDDSKPIVYYGLTEIGTLDFWDEYVEFFGSFQHFHTIYTKLSVNEMKEYGLPECFLDVVKVFCYPNNFKWHHDSLTCGKPEATVIVVLGKDDVKLYSRYAKCKRAICY